MCAIAWAGKSGNADFMLMVKGPLSPAVPGPQDPLLLLGNGPRLLVRGRTGACVCVMVQAVATRGLFPPPAPVLPRLGGTAKVSVVRSQRSRNGLKFSQAGRSLTGEAQDAGILCQSSGSSPGCSTCNPLALMAHLADQAGAADLGLPSPGHLGSEPVSHSLCHSLSCN